MSVHSNQVVAPSSGNVSFSALFSGALIVVAVSWLMFMLGAAIGLEFADSGDVSSMANGLQVGLVVWLIISVVVAYFCGGWICARLSGAWSKSSGTALGATIWAFGTVSMLVLGAWGVGSFFSAAGSVVSATASAVSTTSKTVMNMGQTAFTSIDDWLETELADELISLVKTEASQAIASTQNDFGPTASSEQIRSAISNLSTETVVDIVSMISQGDSLSAAELIADSTSLSVLEIESLGDGIQRRLQSLDQGQVVDEIQNQLDEFVNDIAAVASDLAGAAVTEQQIKRIVNAIDPETLSAVAQSLIQGDWDKAQARLIADTPLTEDQIEQVITNIESEVDALVSTVRQELMEQLQIAADYASAAMWALIIASLLGLLAAIGGGLTGSRSSM